MTYDAKEPQNIVISLSMAPFQKPNILPHKIALNLLALPESIYRLYIWLIKC